MHGPIVRVTENQRARPARVVAVIFQNLPIRKGSHKRLRVHAALSCPLARVPRDYPSPGSKGCSNRVDGNVQYRATIVCPVLRLRNLEPGVGLQNRVLLRCSRVPGRRRDLSTKTTACGFRLADFRESQVASCEPFHQESAWCAWRLDDKSRPCESWESACFSSK